MNLRGCVSGRKISLPSSASIVVCTYKSRKTLDFCLKSLTNLNFDGTYEIIVIDSTPDDSVRETAEGYNVNYFWTPKRGYSRARNLGIRRSTGEFVAFTDSDCIADTDWLANLLRGFSCNEIAGVGGVIYGGVSFKPVWLMDEQGCFDFKKNLSLGWTSTRFPIPFLCTANCAYRKNVLAAVGGFPEQFGAGESGVGGEDVELSVRLQEKGYRLKVVRDARIFHQPVSKKRILKNTVHEGRYSYVLVKAHKLSTFKESLFWHMLSLFHSPTKVLALMGFLYQAAKIESSN